MPNPLPRTSPTLPRHFRLGDWLVDPRAGQIQRGADTVRLEPKVMGVLTHLAAQPGEVVSRHELIEAVWPDVIVTENALSRCVSDLRRALGDDPRTPTLIETIPKTGYRLLQPVVPAELPLLSPLPSGDGVPSWNEVENPTLAPTPGAPRRRRVRAWSAGLALLTALGLALGLRSTTSSDSMTVGTPRPVTSAAGSEGLAALAPAGDRIAYVRFEEGGQMGHIEIVGADGGTPLKLTQGRKDTHPTFSPDGQHLAFLRCVGSRCRPYRITALGTDERPLADLDAHPSGLAWSPDGRLLAFVEQTATTAPLRLVLLDLESGERRPLTTPPATAFGDLFPAFSPDGSRLAFVRRTDAIVGDLYSVSTTGGEATALSTDHSQVARLSWFPDGRNILASSDRDGSFRLWRFPVNGDAPTPLPLEAAMPLGPTLNAAGDRIAVEAWDLPIQLWLYDLTALEPTRRAIAPSTRWDRMPTLSPDARRAVFVSARNGHTELWATDLIDGTAQPLTHLAGPAVRAPQWSPDGQQIAFLVRTDGQADLYTIPASGGLPQRLTTTDTDELHPRWSPDGRSLFVSRRRDARWEGVRLDIETRTDTVIVPGASALAISPDESTLWFARDGTPGLWTLPLDSRGLPISGHVPTRVVPDLAPDDAALWTLTYDGVIYLRRTNELESVVRWSNGETEVLLQGPMALDLWAPALAASQDGKMLLVAQMELPESDVLLAELQLP